MTFNLSLLSYFGSTFALQYLTSSYVLIAVFPWFCVFNVRWGDDIFRRRKAGGRTYLGLVSAVVSSVQWFVVISLSTGGRTPPAQRATDTG